GGLLKEAAEVSTEALHHAEQVFRSNETRDRLRLAMALDQHAISLRDIHQFDRVLPAAEKAEALWHRLAKEQPKTYTVGWARSLSILGASLTEVGRFDD